MSLPEPWIEKIFHRLSVTYGRNWLSMWDGIPIDDVKEDWAEQLAGYQQNPNAITYALENLPHAKPPTVLEFRALCQRGPSKQVEQPARIAYTGPVIDADELRERIQSAIKSAKQPKEKRDPKQWAHDLAAYDRLHPNDVTPTVRTMYKAALGHVESGESA